MKCAVITPIGPGHADIYQNECLPAINVAIETSKGPFSEVLIYAMDDTKGEHGRSARRNDALKKAHEDGVEWVFFQDADDFITPSAFDDFGKVLAEFPEVDGVWGQICELSPDGEPRLREGQPEVLQTYEEFISWRPFLSVQIGAFMKTEVVASIGFDVDMDTGEDFKIYYEMWEKHNCLKVPFIFFINRQGMHSTGPRSANGRDWVASTNEMWKQRLQTRKIYTGIEFDGVRSSVRLTNPMDIIQLHYLSGRFFEDVALSELKKLYEGKAPRILEVGANIGNHVVFYGIHMNAQKIFPVEPNPEAIDLLRDNISVNGIYHLIDDRGIGKGVGETSGRYTFDRLDADNLGATSIKPSDDGDLEVVSVDDLMGDEPIDIMKIDAEGMEFDVLRGAVRCIEKNRPLIWIELLKHWEMDFIQKWCKANDYKVVKSFRHTYTTDIFAIPR
ncbi:FkbM family methyltransferase [Sulfitobacter sp. R18_1]|uniref:FkbM family methyltransferase n=1 Tax=Sulfitobacter sp. R18_1 TaxID=2821104 RepID=UPI001ADC8354|nr:FkbM family methyltransferase [Sulfitobacter sp. R18_1]MBO9428448.1 FkbM family methyltransferase [Sulfitobacter sp. R18_1]